MDTFKRVMLQLFGGLFMEQKDGMWVVSKGSVAFWAVFIHCLWVWTKPVLTTGVAPDVASGELYALFALLGYAGVKKGVDAFSAAKSNGIPLDNGPVIRPIGEQP
jgi:hypothetical protein